MEDPLPLHLATFTGLGSTLLVDGFNRRELTLRLLAHTHTNAMVTDHVGWDRFFVPGLTSENREVVHTLALSETLELEPGMVVVLPFPSDLPASSYYQYFEEEDL